MSATQDSTASLPLRLKRKRSPVDDGTIDQDATESLSDLDQPEQAQGNDGGSDVLLTPPRPSKKRRELDDELAALGDEVEREEAFTEQTEDQAKVYLPKRKGVTTREKERSVIAKKWTPGWLQHIGESVRPPADLSRNLIIHPVVMSTFMSVADARDALRKRVKGNRPFGPADVKKACWEVLGRPWAQLKSEAFAKIE